MTADEFVGYDKALEGLKYPTTYEDVLMREKIKMAVLGRKHSELDYAIKSKVGKVKLLSDKKCKP